MTCEPEGTGPSIEPKGDGSEALDHELLNEIHAVVLGARLLREQIGAGEWVDAARTSEAILVSGERMQELYRRCRQTGRSCPG